MTRSLAKYVLITSVFFPIIGDAAPITRTFEFSASFAAGSILPNPATGTLTVTFDPDGGDVSGATSATLDSANFAVDSGLEFNFFTSTDSIQVGGTLNGLAGVFNGTNDFLLSLDFLDSSTPVFVNMFLAQTGFDQALSTSGSVQLAPQFTTSMTSGPFLIAPAATSVDWMLLNNDSDSVDVRVTVYSLSVGAAKVPVAPGPLTISLAPGELTHNANGVGSVFAGTQFEVVVESTSEAVHPNVNQWSCAAASCWIPGTLIPSADFVRTRLQATPPRGRP